MQRARHPWARSRLIADTGTTQVRDVRPGTVEIRGTAHPAEEATVIESPITKADAVATDVTVEGYQSDNDGGGSWPSL
jgi:hypothetical protein